MKETSIIGLDLAKYVFQVHGFDEAGSGLLRKKLRRDQLLAFFAAQPKCVVAMEACSSSHYWGREIGNLGHTVRLIPPAYVKPFVKRHKNDAADAEAICEAALRPTMRFVAVKSEVSQAAAIVFQHAIFSCGIERRSSMPCETILLSLELSLRKVRLMLPN